MSHSPVKLRSETAVLNDTPEELQSLLTVENLGNEAQSVKINL